MRTGLLRDRQVIRPGSGEGYDGPPLDAEPSMLERARIAGQETDLPFDEWFIEEYGDGAEAIPEATKRELAEQFQEGRLERNASMGGGGGW